MRMRTDRPVYALMLQLPVAHAPLRLLAAPAWLNSWVVPALWTIETRKKSALDEFDPCARYQDRDKVSVPLAGNVMAGERMLVVPPSMSKSPAAVPAAPP